MARNRDHVDLDVLAHLLKLFAETPWLHYGLWREDEVPSFPTMRAAQERYVDKLVGLLPPAPARILDIGGGTGAMAGHLTGLGYTVEMLTPSAEQVGIAREKLGASVRVHQSRFEDFSSDQRFDVCLFSESFQYIGLNQVFAQLDQLLAPGGRVVIADCFRTEAFRAGTPTVGGGHRYTRALHAIEAAGYRIDSNEDVTSAAAKSITLDQRFYREAAAPLVTLVDRTLTSRRPFLGWLARSVYGLAVPARERERLATRLAATYRTPEQFIRDNTYRFMVLTRSGA
jgi:cyclopropane fatty-acyl-phospholipid synthase-like methyltransferase